MCDYLLKGHTCGGIMTRYTPYWQSEGMFTSDTGEWVKFEDVQNAPQMCWLVERQMPGFTLYFTLPTGYWDDGTDVSGYGPFFDSNWDRALKFFDRASCQLCCAGMPDDWDIKIMEHQIG